MKIFKILMVVSSLVFSAVAIAQGLVKIPNITANTGRELDLCCTLLDEICNPDEGFIDSKITTGDPASPVNSETGGWQKIEGFSCEASMKTYTKLSQLCHVTWDGESLPRAETLGSFWYLFWYDECATSREETFIDQGDGEDDDEEIGTFPGK